MIANGRQRCSCRPNWVRNLAILHGRHEKLHQNVVEWKNFNHYELFPYIPPRISYTDGLHRLLSSKKHTKRHQNGDKVNVSGRLTIFKEIIHCRNHDYIYNHRFGLSTDWEAFVGAREQRREKGGCGESRRPCTLMKRKIYFEFWILFYYSEK